MRAEFSKRRRCAAPLGDAHLGHDPPEARGGRSGSKVDPKWIEAAHFGTVLDRYRFDPQRSRAIHFANIPRLLVRIYLVGIGV